MAAASAAVSPSRPPGWRPGPPRPPVSAAPPVRPGKDGPRPGTAPLLAGLDAGLRGQLACGYRRLQTAVVELILPGVTDRELADSRLEGRRPAQVGTQSDPVAGARVRAGQSAAAERPVGEQSSRAHVLDGDRVLPGAQLADVVVGSGTDLSRPGGTARRAGGTARLPAEEDVAADLHEPLSGHDPLALARLPRSPGELAQHGGLSLLDLQEQQVPRVAAGEQHDPAAHADAADARDLAGQVSHLVLADQMPPGWLERLAVAGDE